METTAGNKGFGLVALMVVATAFASHHAPVPDTPADPMAGDEGYLPGRMPGVLAVDTPPRPVTVPAAAPGWPFQQLPMVAKFGFPERPRAEPVPIRPPFILVRTPPFPVPPRTPVVDAPTSPLWLLTPLALGLAVGNVSEVGRVAVVPEPASLLLVATGFGVIALKVRRRRPRDRRRA